MFQQLSCQADKVTTHVRLLSAILAVVGRLAATVGGAPVLTK
jgi:hypothetical protein